MHSPHTPEIIHAINWLKYEKIVKSDTEIAKKLGKDQSYISKLRTGKEKPSADFEKSFEAAFLMPRKKKLRDFKEELSITIEAPVYASAEEFLVARVQYLEFQIEELIELSAKILANQSGLKSYEPIKKKVDESIRAKAAKVRAAQGAK